MANRREKLARAARLGLRLYPGDSDEGTQDVASDEKSPRELWRLTDDERAELERRLNDPTRVPREVAWLDDGPDPFGVNYAWAAPPEDQKGIPLA